MSILQLEEVSYSYDGKTQVLEDINYTFEKGKVYAITGKSGSGKTTLLSLIAGLTSPTKGRIIYNNTDISSFDRYEYRSKYVGVVFQKYNLIPSYSALQNVVLSIDVSEKDISDKKAHALATLSKVGIDEIKAKRTILKLSGGEEQRVAIARALSYNPEIILADEPTGSLDGENKSQVLNTLTRLAKKEEKCIIIVTHSPDVAKNADEVFQLGPMMKSESELRREVQRFKQSLMS